MRNLFLAILFLLVFLGLWVCRAPEDPTLLPAFDESRVAPPPALRATPPATERSVFFGDLHIHTSLSLDAYMFGVRAGPEDAYRFAKGGSISHGAGYEIRLSEPLDFAAVTDHAEYLGMLEAMNPDLPLSNGALRETLLSRNRFRMTYLFIDTMRNFFVPGQGDVGDPAIMRKAWARTVAAAEQADVPGAFTAFIAYEWTGMLNGGNLHRNVVYRGSQAPIRPFSADDSSDPEGLWAALADQSAEGMEALAIPHNANVSDGLMFADETLRGEDLNAEYAERRNRWEPLQEIFQVKGQSEAHPVLSVDDEFADFEIKEGLLSFDRRKGVLPGSYARDALREGLAYRMNEGFDPFDFGVIGSSDGHGASAPVEEDRFHGKLPMMDGTAGIRMATASLIPSSSAPAKEWGSGGLAAVWAEENTRDSLFDAMRRRETYATSGTRIRVRLFAGWDYPDGLLAEKDGLRRAYAEGVPMGATLAPPPDSVVAAESAAPANVPRLAVWALKDPTRAHLDRIQIVKLWADSEGGSHEKIYDVAASGNRMKEAERGVLAPVGNTVDVAEATYTNTIGAPELMTVWSDPDFDSSLPCRYYARVLEIPTPRWTAYDARALGIEAPEPSSIQERAVTSAITYLPAELR